jgi:ribosomal protein L11 methyltransferase
MTASADGPWVVRIPLAADDDPELMSARLWSLGTTGVAELGGDQGPHLIAGFDDATAAERAVAALDRAGLTLGRVDPGGWVEEWRRASVPTRVGPLVIRAPWHPAEPWGGGNVHLVIDPGPTFGHGGHPTTRLILAQLARLVRSSTTVLDVGSGSGVLAVAAAALGAARVVAVDTDPDAIAATRANASVNGVGVDAFVGTVDPAQGRFDLVLANLLAPVLRELGPRLVPVVAAGGTLLVAGLLADQRDGVVDALRPLAPVRSDSDGDWLLLELRTPPPTRSAPGVAARG